MSRILLTGMSAAQASAPANSRTLSFTGAINKSLLASGHSVTWAVPQIDWTDEFLDSFDSVVVGVSPITSLSANYCYGGLSTIARLWESNKLTLLIDAPQVSQLEASFRTISANPERLTKDFYVNRKGFQLASTENVRKSLLAAVDRLLNEVWPVTIYPSLPWKDDTSVHSQLVAGAKENLVGISVDAELVKDPIEVHDRRLKWSTDHFSTPWSKSTLQTIIYPASPMRWHKGWDDNLVQDQISRSIGALISPHKNDGTWWSHRYIQALNTLTPVASLWQETSALGEAWSYLAATIETVSQDERDSIALEQRSSYLQAIPSLEEARSTLETTLRINKGERK